MLSLIKDFPFFGGKTATNEFSEFSGTNNTQTWKVGFIKFIKRNKNKTQRQHSAMTSTLILKNKSLNDKQMAPFYSNQIQVKRCCSHKRCAESQFYTQQSLPHAVYLSSQTGLLSNIRLSQLFYLKGEKTQTVYKVLLKKLQSSFYIKKQSLQHQCKYYSTIFHHEL